MDQHKSLWSETFLSNTKNWAFPLLGFTTVSYYKMDIMEIIPCQGDTLPIIQFKEKNLYINLPCNQYVVQKCSFCLSKRLRKQKELTGANSLDHVEIFQLVIVENFVTI